MKILVVPSIRENSLTAFINKWKPYRDWDKLIVVEDNPEPTFKVDCDAHYSWKDIDKELGKDAWIISRRDSAIRSYGFLKAYQEGADYIFTLDDDCLPGQDPDFCNGHVVNILGTSKWTDSIPDYRTRGKPYKSTGVLSNVMFSMGLWSGVPDLDAIHMLTNHLPPPVLPSTRIMPHGQYFPFCGMNFAFKREVTVLTYFPLMGLDQPYARFDDIWFGIICKKICDHLNYAITVGKPYVYHSKASDAFNNLVKEAPGIKQNEDFWQIIDSVILTKDNPKGCMIEIGIALQVSTDNYLKKLGTAIVKWSELFPNP